MPVKRARFEFTPSERSSVRRLLPAFSALATVLPETFNRLRVKDLAKMFASPNNWPYFVKVDAGKTIDLLYRQVKLIRLSPLYKDNSSGKRPTKPGLHNPPANITAKAKSYWPTFWLKRSKTDSKQRQYKTIILTAAKRVEHNGHRHFASELDRLKYTWAVAIIIFSRSCLKHRIPFVENRKKSYVIDPKITLAKALKVLASSRDRRMFALAITRLIENYKVTRHFVVPKL